MSKSEDNLREGFEGLSDALGTEFEMEASDGGVSKESPSEGIVEVSEKTLPFSDTSENVMSDEEEKYIEALAFSIEEFWKKNGKPQKIIFSYHGIPKRYLTNGDPYHCFCLKTTRLVKEKINLQE